VHRAQDWTAFCSQYHADLKAADRPVPEKLLRYFGKTGTSPATAIEQSSAKPAPILMSFSQAQASATKKQETDTTKRCFFCGY